MNATTGLSWFGIVRLGGVQLCLGAMFVLMTSLVNRVIAVELALPAAFAGALMSVHYSMQLLRPHFGHGSDSGGARTPWIIGGMAALACGATLASIATTVMATHTALGMALAVAAFMTVGCGVGAAGTSLLVLVAAKVSAPRRAAAAGITFGMMIVGFIISTAVVQSTLEPFSFARMQWVVGIICACAFTLSVVSVFGIERRNPDVEQHDTGERDTRFWPALKEVLSEPTTRLFSAFIAISMFGYGLQDLVLEPFGGAIFGLSPAESTGLSKLHNMGIMLGMIVMGVVGVRYADALRLGSAFGCVASAVSLMALAILPTSIGIWDINTNVFAIGVGNGLFSVAAIGNMMRLVSEGAAGRQGVRMGVWGSAQAIAMGAGSVCGTIIVDIVRYVGDNLTLAYTSVFSIQAGLFAIAALLALRIRTQQPAPASLLSVAGKTARLESSHETL
ncbi:MAG: BCD family MFS transporter [Pseudomonadota bacterium]